MQLDDPEAAMKVAAEQLVQALAAITVEYLPTSQYEQADADANEKNPIVHEPSTAVSPNDAQKYPDEHVVHALEPVLD